MAQVKIGIVLLCCINILFSQQNHETQIASEIDSLVNFVNPKAPGVTIGVFKDGDIYMSQKGMANLEYQVPFNKETVFGLASVTKQFTAACIGILQHKKLLHVNDNVQKYVPELPNYGNELKIKHLLNHTSGIRNHNVLLNLQGFDFNHFGYTNDYIQKLIFKQKGINNSPGAKMLYSNSNYVLLALIIERVSGMSLASFAKKELFEPLGLQQTFYKKYLGQVINNRAYSYYKEGGVYKQTVSVTHCIGAGGAASTVQDMLQWSQLFLSKQSKLSYLNEFLTTLDNLNNGEQMQYARGVFVSPYKGVRTINHSGRDLGMRSQLICLPNKNLSVVVFTNSENINAVNLSYKIIDLFIEKPDNNETKQDEYFHSNAALQKIVGSYQELNSDLGMKVILDKETIKAKSTFGNNFIALKATGKNAFKRVDNQSVSYHFYPDTAKTHDLVVDFGGAKFYFEKVQLATPENLDITDFLGEYYSEELEVKYRLFAKNNKLYLSYPNQPKLQLFLGKVDEFGAKNRTRYSFKRNKSNKVVSFTVASEGTVKNILFQKIKH